MTRSQHRTRRIVPAAVTALTTAAVLLAGGVNASAASPLGATTSSRATEQRLTQAGRAVLAAGATAFVGTVHDGRRTTSVALGVADRRTGRPARLSDEFQIGSTTKTVTATVVLQLVGERRLSLDDTVERWLPGKIPNGKNITVRMLLQHTSGLFDYTADETFNGALLTQPTRRYTPQQLLAVALKHQPTFAPGKGWAYSNTGFLVAGMILRAVTGDSAAELITERIITPLHLKHTYWARDGLFQGKHLHGYYRTEPNGTKYVDISRYPITWADAAGALISTTADLGRFERALQSGALLKPAQLAQLRTTVEIPGTGGQYAYGLGLIRITTPNGYVWGHTGGTIGYLTQAWASEDGTRSIVENVPTGAATPAGPDSSIEAAASAAAATLFSLLAD